MYKKNNVIVGVIFIALGAMFLLRNLNIFSIYFDLFDIFYLIGWFWPSLFLLLPSVIMHGTFFSGKNKDANILVPAGILLTIGVTCQLSTFFGIWHIMWPGFIAAVAVGLLELYIFGHRDKSLLVPIGILGGLSIIFFTSTIQWLIGYNFRNLVVPGALIAIGGVIIYKNWPRRDKF